MTQTTNNHPGEPTCREISAETMKIPEPIIDPATSIVESSKPSPRTNFSSDNGGAVVSKDGIWSLGWRRVNQSRQNQATPKRDLGVAFYFLRPVRCKTTFA